MCVTACQVLRELFAYKPPVTKEQFFTAGFGERKVIMCTQVIQLVLGKHRSLVGVSRSTSIRRHHRPNETLPATPTTAAAAATAADPSQVLVVFVR